MTGQLALPGTATLELPAVVVPIPAVEQLLAALIAGTVGATCNFYAGTDAGARQRRERLRCYLTARWAAPVVLVGEAPGYRGACRSGVPFTSERQVVGVGCAEASATIVRRVLGELGIENEVLCWNAVPYHPHLPGCHDSNRTPTPEEVAACQHLLAAVCAGRRVIAVGRVAATAACQASGDDVPVVRHPAHGGARAFAEGLARLLATEPEATR